MELVTPGIGLIVWQTVIFLFTLVILGKFAWKPILKGLKTREESISDALNAAEKARKALAGLESKNEELLKLAREEREKILTDANTIASQLKVQAEADAKRLADKLVSDAQASIQAEKNAALAEVKNQVAEFSVIIAEKVIRKQLENKQASKELVNEYVNDLKLN